MWWLYRLWKVDKIKCRSTIKPLTCFHHHGHLHPPHCHGCYKHHHPLWRPICTKMAANDCHGNLINHGSTCIWFSGDERFNTNAWIRFLDLKVSFSASLYFHTTHLGKYLDALLHRVHALSKQKNILNWLIKTMETCWTSCWILNSPCWWCIYIHVCVFIEAKVHLGVWE